ncbi:hypothetical protein BJY52DRAFT_1264266 [Lactarius psammicola]|nr:hypothetical protein BJY52DRAFT_1264266 [Lactarius psammicola]
MLIKVTDILDDLWNIFAMVYTNQPVRRRATGGIGHRGKSLHMVCTAITRNLFPDSWARPPRHLWHATAKRLFPRTKCPVMAIKHDIEKLVASLAGRDERNSPEAILPLAEVIDIIHDSMREYGLRVEDHTRVRALIALIDQMRDLLEGDKEEVEDEIGADVVSGDERDDVSRRGCPFLSMSSETLGAGSAVWSESQYTVRSVVSWKERTSWFFRPSGARGKIRKKRREGTAGQKG